MTPTSGYAQVDDVMVTELSETQRAAYRLAHIGLVFQEHELLQEFDAADNAALTLILAGERRSSARRQAIDVLTQLGLEEKAGTSIDRLSGGEAQRVAIARAVIKTTRVILADEPTASLDETNAHLIADELLRLSAQRNASLVIATHDLAISEKCERVLSLR